ncbi:transglycosylase SLT domain-containing protein [Paenibacillus alvei]|uniref:transglycosylase SLT domain-containing protein n=1 Tax=Paenibacillus alvei TaxID=44250 RepID=UPI002282A00F|nr:transglycosylase SLT domain-containing protein [Paenibacillus alvei]MCY9737544.1 transglycosylase SLT domain-containing protein [Paenibacillus alvei]
MKKKLVIMSVTFIVAVVGTVGVKGDNNEVSKASAAGEKVPAALPLLHEKMFEMHTVQSETSTDQKQTNEQKNTQNNKDNKKVQTTKSKENIEPYKKYNVPLTDAEKKYLWEKCKEKGIQFDLALAIMKTESDFRKHLTSDTNDHGIMQVNGETAKYMLRLFDDLPSDYDLYDYKTNVQFGLAELKYLQNTWRDKGLSKSKEQFYIIVSYNRGVAGAKRWVRDNGFNNQYYDKVVGNMDTLKTKGGFKKV